MVPGALVFGRDVNVNVPFITDIKVISANWQLQTDACPMHENQQCIQHECAVGDNVCVNNHHFLADKLPPAWVGLFPILRVHTNGTVIVQLEQMHKQISVSCIKPAAGL